MIEAARRPLGDDGPLLSEVVLSTLVAPEDELLPHMTSVVTGVASELAGCPPLGVVLDLAYVLLAPVLRLDEARRRLQSDLPVDGELARAVGAVFDAFLAPLMASQAVIDVRDALKRHPEELRLRGAAIVVAEILARQTSSKKSGKALDLGAVRRVLSRPAPEIRARGASYLFSSRVKGDLLERYQAFARSSRLGGQLVTKGDLLIAENAPVLAKRAARVGLAHIADAAEAIALLIPKNLAHKRARGDDVITRQKEENAYPMGGFSSMSNVGSIESVVSSELAYSNPDGEMTDDLFTVRWALGELLYYTRDESVATRRRTTVSILLDADLEGARVKDRSAPYQRIVLALASIVVLVERAIYLLRDESVRFVIAFDGDKLEPEKHLLDLALVRQIGAGQVETRVVADPGDVARFEEDERARVRVVTLRLQAGDERAAPDDARMTKHAAPRVVRVEGTPSLLGEGTREPAGRGSSALDAWATVTRALLQGL